MDNIVSQSSSQISSNTGNPLNPQPIPPLASELETTSTIEAIVSTPLEPIPTTIEQTNTDGNVQTHIDVKYEAHDVALESVKTNGHQQKNGFTSSEHHKIDIDDNDQHSYKSKSCCSMLNKLFLILAIVCFALFLFSIAYIFYNLKELNGKHGERILSKKFYPYSMDDDLSSSERLIDDIYFNLTHRNDDGIIVVLSRRGASINDILIPYNDKNNSKQYRSIVIKGGSENYFGSIRFGFDDPTNTMNMTNQLPPNYPFLNLYKENWSMYVDKNNPYRVRFVYQSIQIIYEFSSENSNEFIMKTIISTPSNRQIIVDLTNNIYFNLRSYGNLSTHYLNLSSSNPIDILYGQKVEQDRLIQSTRVDILSNINKYFYKLDRAGIGKNYIATLYESETKTTMRIFSDHTGVVIDPFGVGSSNQNENHATTIPDMRGVRISPRQSPVYQPMSIYGPTLITYPSEAIHTTWWQFDYEN
ncbi:unnamed protein product [Rotaria sordida]|uniref:Uncharacterized protein n=2 Tax=Rotaria sordida TaxID=392033 RepID=A0A814GSQ4_9BILA|nr:unnamed protein product [Rotaria sordida]CAF1084152.1 unnamed protein product [Rotaria sordida]